MQRRGKSGPYADVVLRVRAREEQQRLRANTATASDASLGFPAVIAPQRRKSVRLVCANATHVLVCVW